jgi:hypothetical protein
MKRISLFPSRIAMTMLALSAVMTVCLLPQTGWLARLQVKMAVAPLTMSRQFAGEAEKTATPPTTEQFMSESAAHAALLRAMTESKITLKYHPDEEKNAKNAAKPLTETERTNALKRVNLPDNLALFDKTAAAGEKLAPKNAYFPLMRSIGLFAAGRDTDAHNAIHRAAQCPDWNEYIADYAEAKWAISEAQQGTKLPALNKVAISAAILFPHYSALRSVARIAHNQSAEQEQAGDIAGGFTLREDLLAASAKVRGESSTLIGNLVGIAMHTIATSNTNGVKLPTIKEIQKPGESDQDVQKRRQAMSVAQWEAWCRHNNRTDLVSAAAEDAVFQQGIMGLMDAASDKNPMDMTMLIKEMLYLACGIGLIGLSLWLTILGGVFHGLSLTPRVREGKRIHPSVKWGAWTGLSTMILGPVLLALTTYPEAQMTMSGFVVCCLSAGMWQAVRLREPQTTVWTALLWTLASMFAFCALLLPLGAFIALPIVMIAGAVPNTPQLIPIAIAIFALIPLGTLGYAIWRGKRAGVPASAGVARYFPRVALPVLATLLILWSAVQFPLSCFEDNLQSGLHTHIQHEGRFLAELSGRVWGKVK